MTSSARTIGFLHTSAVHVDTFERLVRQIDPEIETVHCVATALLDEARADGATDSVVAGTLAGLQQLVDESCTVIVCTCSTLGGLAEGLQDELGQVPVLRVDRPMARAAISIAPPGAAIGVVAALSSTLAPTRDLLLNEAQRAGCEVRIDEVLIEAAWGAFEAGDLPGYLDLVANAARELAARVGVVVLAQASMAPVVEALSDVGVPVLASPAAAVRAALAAG